MDPVLVARIAAGGRVAVGLSMLVAPGLTARALGSNGAEGSAAVLLSRGFGARDMALGVGALAAVPGPAASRWLLAGAAADAADFAAFALAGDRLRPALRIGGMAVAATAGLGGLALAGRSG